MEEKYPDFREGYVVVRITHPSPERFLNMCAHRGICLYDLEIRNQELILKLSRPDFFQLKPLVRKSGVKIRILEKHGLPFFFYRNKKRKAFFVGILVSFCLIGMLSSHIWNIHVEGNRRISTKLILEFLEEQKITHGIAKKNVNCGELAAAVRKNFPEVTWVSVKIVGTRLMLTIQENTDRELIQTVREEEPCSIAADKEGTIVKLVAKRGMPLMFPGAECKVGDVLVSGCLEILNDSKEVVRYEYVPAQAEITLRRELVYQDSFPLKHTEKVFTGNCRYSWGMQAGPYRGETGYFGKALSKSDQVYTEAPLYLTENFRLPFLFYCYEEKEYEEREALYSQEEAKALAEAKIQIYQKHLLEEGIQIAENLVTVEVENGICQSNGILVIEEEAGIKIPVEQEEVPKNPEQE